MSVFFSFLYFAVGVNSGMILMNLTKMRNRHWAISVDTVYAKYAQLLVWHDQNIINVIFHDNPGKSRWTSRSRVVRLNYHDKNWTYVFFQLNCWFCLASGTFVSTPGTATIAAASLCQKSCTETLERCIVTRRIISQYIIKHSKK